MLPALFVAHGSPMLAVEQNEYVSVLEELARTVARPRRIVVFSAHWVDPVQTIGSCETNAAIHDFGGFPRELYTIQYPASGDPGLAREMQEALARAGIRTQLDGSRGLDHGAWVVLRLMYPAADIPVVALSVNPSLEPRTQYEIGRALSWLRTEDILIIGSGGTVHNLGAIRWDESVIDQWAVDFDHWLEQKLEAWDLDALDRYSTEAPHASLAVPPMGSEHLAPLFYAMGSADQARTARLVHRSYRYGSLSQSIWQFG